MTKYIHRDWLTADNHSSSYVMCHYDLSCLNADYRLFVRIADCTDVFQLKADPTKVSMRSLIKHIRGILLVLDGVKKSYTFGPTYNRYRVTTFKCDWSESVSIYNIGTNKSTKLLVRIHKDAMTCFQDEWDRKVGVLRQSLTEFVNFLQTKVDIS